MLIKMATVTHEVTVRRIGSGWNVRVFTDGKLSQEMRVFNKCDIGWAARYMLRWEDKCGNISEWSKSARKRHNRDSAHPVGRVIYPAHMENHLRNRSSDGRALD